MGLKKLATLFGWPLLVLPTAIMCLGMAMNETVIWANGGQMPVSMYACSERMNSAPADDEDAMTTLFGKHGMAPVDYTHKCADKNTKLHWLDDFLVSDEGTASIGDELQELQPMATNICGILWIACAAFCLIRKEKFYWE
jgi:hypothetical protein